jgi:hypothetical protein
MLFLLKGLRTAVILFLLRPPELTPGPSLQAERGAQILAFIPDYLVVFEYAASDIPPLCFQRKGRG